MHGHKYLAALNCPIHLRKNICVQPQVTVVDPYVKARETQLQVNSVRGSMVPP